MAGRRAARGSNHRPPYTRATSPLPTPAARCRPSPYRRRSTAVMCLFAARRSRRASESERANSLLEKKRAEAPRNARGLTRDGHGFEVGQHVALVVLTTVVTAHVTVPHAVRFAGSIARAQPPPRACGLKLRCLCAADKAHASKQWDRARAERPRCLRITSPVSCRKDVRHLTSQAPLLKDVCFGAWHRRCAKKIFA